MKGSSNKKGGFYRISLETGSKPQLIGSGTSNGRVAAAGGSVAGDKANEPHGNLPNQSVITNNPSYGFLEAQTDLYKIRKWAGDLGKLASKHNRNETLMALFDAASRYYPDVDTKKVVRIMLADIKAESHFKKGQVSGGRVDSGNSVGLIQVSPGKSSQELSLFKKVAQSKYNTYSWSAGTGSSDEIQHGGFSTLGPLSDFKSASEIKLNHLSNDDLTHPWINIHVAMWIQSNLARTGSQDPSEWGKVASKSKLVRKLIAPIMKKIVGGTSPSSSSAQPTAREESVFSKNSYKKELKTLKHILKGKHNHGPSFATGLGSWVAGPSGSDDSGYGRSGDDISTQYFKHISKGLSVLYTGSDKDYHKYGKSWLEDIKLTPGLVDYAGKH